MEETKSSFYKSGSLISFLLYCIPFYYFFRSRLKDASSIIFHGWYEWLAGIMVLVFVQNLEPLEAGFSYLKAYIAFISIYEIGYLINDYYSVRKESAPRMRIKDFHLNEEWQILAWILVRIGFFLLFSYIFAIGSLTWMFFSFLLVFVFVLHNVIKIKQVKFLTFINLALLRFTLPLVPFMAMVHMKLLIPLVLVNYVLYRTISYIDSKGNLAMPERKEGWFKLSFYALLLPVNLMLVIVYESNFPVIFNLYYLFFWSVYFLKSKLVPAT